MKHQHGFAHIFLLIGGFIVVTLFIYGYIQCVAVDGCGAPLVNTMIPDEFSTQSLTQPTENTDGDLAGDIFSDENYGFEFSHPRDWKIHYDRDFLQIQKIKNDEVVSIIGSIVPVGITNTDGDEYKKIFDSRIVECPEASGEIVFSDTTDVYCFTGEEILYTNGVWYESHVCSASYFYGLQNDPLECPLTYWTQTPDKLIRTTFNRRTGLENDFLSSFNILPASYPLSTGGSYNKEWCENLGGTIKSMHNSVCINISEDDCRKVTGIYYENECRRPIP